MADTIRTRVELLTLLADNVTGDISPQDMRDVLVTVHGVYGGLYKSGPPVLQPVITPPQKLLNWTSIFPEAGVNASIGSSDITVNTDGIYKVEASFSFTGDLATENWLFELAVNGTPVGPACEERLDGFGIPMAACSFSGLITASAADKLSIEVSPGTGGSGIGLTYAQFLVHRVA